VHDNPEYGKAYYGDCDSKMHPRSTAALVCATHASANSAAIRSISCCTNLPHAYHARTPGMIAVQHSLSHLRLGFMLISNSVDGSIRLRA
jgi:hypothetical protein